MTSTAEARRRAKPTAKVSPLAKEILGDPKRAAQFLKEVQERISHTRIEQYKPYAKQSAFHDAGMGFRERLLLASNQTGKTYSAGAETTFHLTGQYPVWWKGRRFEAPTAGWAAGVTNEATRDTVQRILCGRAEQLGTGMIPKDLIINTTAARGIADAVDTIFVRHVPTGGVSQLTFKSYEEKRTRWQGETLQFVWLDEEPPPDLYTEALTRTNATNGIVFMTFTPLLGMSEVVRMFYPRPNTPDRFMVQMTIDDAEHIPKEMRDKIIASYKPHEREARTRGVPQLGSGAIFTIPESTYVVPAFNVPEFWPQLGAIDLGFDHPFGAARLAFDREADVIYLTNTHRAERHTIKQHAEVLLGWGRGLPIAWPHDGNQHDRQSAQTFAELYRQQGLEMLFEHATFPDGGYGLEASVADLIDRLESGRLKIFSHLTDILEEMRTYHRKDGKIVKDSDDIISALRYGLMMERFASRTRKSRHSSGPVKRNLRVY